MISLPQMFKNPAVLIALPVVTVIIGASVFGIVQYKKLTGELAKAQTATPGQLTDDRQRELIAEVASKIMLPQDEKPTVAVVSDINRLKDQQFFTLGQNGDVVLIYMNTKRAILYRPSEKKIIEVAPVNLNQNPQASVAGATTNVAAVPSSAPQPTALAKETPTPTPIPAPPKFSLRNGTTIVGLARTFETQLMAKFPTATVVERGNATTKTYQTSLLIDVTGKRGIEAQQIAGALGITKGVLPPDEPLPANADFLVIIGADKK